jgi:hypothetical protein
MVVNDFILPGGKFNFFRTISCVLPMMRAKFTGSRRCAAGLKNTPL